MAIDEEILKKVKKLYASGLTTKSEVNKVESSLALARSNLVVQENTVKTSAYNLKKLLGRYLKEYEITEVDTQINLPKTKQKAIEIALKNNPSLMVNEFNIKQAKEAYRKSYANYYPKLDLDLSANYNKNLNGIKGKYDSYKGMVYLSYNFFNGFKDQASIEKSLKSISKETQRKENTLREIKKNIDISWDTTEKLQEQLKYLIKYKDESKLTMQLYTKEYDLGRRSLLDLLTAQNDFINSKAKIISTRYAIIEAKFKILDAMGILVKTLLGDAKEVYDKVSIK